MLRRILVHSCWSSQAAELSQDFRRRKRSLWVGVDDRVGIKNVSIGCMGRGAHRGFPGGRSRANRNTGAGWC